MSEQSVGSRSVEHWVSSEFAVHRDGDELDTDAVRAFKGRFRDDPSLCGKLTVHIVDTLIPKDDLLADEYSSEEADAFRDSTFRSWSQAIDALVESPDDTWVIGIVGPTVFIKALQELDSVGATNG